MAEQTYGEWMRSNPEAPFMSAIDYLTGQLRKPFKEWDEDIYDKSKNVEKQNMVNFHRWMKKNDTPENAERYAGYSDNDMLEEYLKSN